MNDTQILLNAGSITLFCLGVLLSWIFLEVREIRMILQTSTDTATDIEKLGLTEKDIEEFGEHFLKNVDKLAEIDEDPRQKSNQKETKQ